MALRMTNDRPTNVEELAEAGTEAASLNIVGFTV
jgi:hypothetical protein